MDKPNRKLRMPFVVSLCLLILIALVYLCADHSTYISFAADLPDHQGYEHHSLQPYFRYAGQTVLMDQEDTLYLPVDPSGASDIESLFSPLQLKRPGYRFCLLQDEYFSDPMEGIRLGHPFTLAVLDPLNRYMECRVVFTSLPVIMLSSETNRLDSERDRTVYSGRFLMQDPNKIGSFPEFSEAEWHVRGHSTARGPKPPLKLNLRNSKHKNQNMNLLDLGKDDDWILNSMVLEDTKVREKLFMDLWNSLPGEPPMSRGRYVEVIQDGSYMGLYLLQRRVDSKYLQLQDSDWLFKGRLSWAPETVYDGYELISGSQEGYSLLEPVWSGQDMSILDTDNFSDVNLFLQFGGAVDNSAYKNMFYIIRNAQSGPSLELLPWDTDSSFGLLWSDDYYYDYDSCRSLFVDRMELSALQKQNPRISYILSHRWAELRNGVLSEENILSVLDPLVAEINASGSYSRDQALWGSLFDGMDSQDSLRSWICERLLVLDEYYSGY